MHPSQLCREELLKDCQFRADRRSGPGGQHRNKVASAAILTHLPTGISAEANERRSQADNRKAAEFRLRLNLALEFRTAAPRTASVTWSNRVRNGKIAIASTHQDFPAILAEALNVLAESGFEVRQAAEQLEVSNSQLIGLLRQHPPALRKLNEFRVSNDLKPLK